MQNEDLDGEIGVDVSWSLWTADRPASAHCLNAMKRASSVAISGLSPTS
jgi:hypothetical protein